MGEKPRVAASVEVACEVAEAMLELDVPAVRAPVVDEEDAEVLERALEHASASFPRRAGGRELIERVGAVRNANAIHATQHIVERARRHRGRSGSFPDRYRHRSRVYVRGAGHPSGRVRPPASRELRRVALPEVVRQLAINVGRGRRKGRAGIVAGRPRRLGEEVDDEVFREKAEGLAFCVRTANEYFRTPVEANLTPPAVAYYYGTLSVMEALLLADALNHLTLSDLERMTLN